MPYYRRKYRHRRRRRNFRKKYHKKTKFNKSPSTGYLFIKQKAFTDVTVPVQTSGDLECYIKTFQLQDVANQWAQVFDQFRIVGCKVTFWPTTAATAGSQFSNQQILYTSIDLDGQNPLPVTEAQLLERSNVKQRILTAGGGNPQFHTHYVRPRTAKAIYSGGVLSAYGLDTRKTWLDIRTSINAPHYGLIYGFAAPSGTQVPIDYRIQTTYYLQFRKVI